jgi:hypothetical protein
MRARVEERASVTLIVRFERLQGPFTAREQVDRLSRRVDNLQTLLGKVVSVDAIKTVSEVSTLSGASSDTQRRRSCTDSMRQDLPRFSGPTSSTFGINIAADILSQREGPSPQRQNGSRSLLGLTA